MIINRSLAQGGGFSAYWIFAVPWVIKAAHSTILLADKHQQEPAVVVKPTRNRSPVYRSSRQLEADAKTKQQQQQQQRRVGGCFPVKTCAHRLSEMSDLHALDWTE